MDRESTSMRLASYVLWPYFGGDETATHYINIDIIKAKGFSKNVTLPKWKWNQLKKNSSSQYNN